MNTSSPFSFPVLQESESPVPGDFFAVTPDANTGLRMNKKGNGYVALHLPNGARARFDFAAPGLASFVWGSAKSEDTPWLVQQAELPPDIMPSASLRRLFLLTCAPLPVALCAFSPCITTEEDGWNLFKVFPNVMLLSLRTATLINPRFEQVVMRWELKGDFRSSGKASFIAKLSNPSA